MTNTTNAANSSPITAECAANTKTDCRSQLEALIDIYDDAHNNDPESRCYVDGAFAEQMAEARAFLKAAPQPQGMALILTNDQKTLLKDELTTLLFAVDGGYAMDTCGNNIADGVAEIFGRLSAPSLTDERLNCTLSWGGHNVCGDNNSIQAVKTALHEAGHVPHLRNQIAYERKRADGAPSAPQQAEYMLQLLEAAGHVTPSQIAQARGIARTALPASRVGDGASESKYCELCAKRGIDGCQCGSMGIAGLIAELEQQGDPVQYIEFAQDGYQCIADVFTEAFKPTKRLTGAELVGTVCELIRSAASTQQDEQRNGGKK